MVSQQQVDSFHAFATEHVQSGDSELTISELFDLWNAQSATADEFAESVAAVRSALHNMDNGDNGRPFDDFAEELRQRTGHHVGPNR